MDVYIEKDRTNAPFLLASSFNGLISFLGSYSENGVVFWKFSPKDKALTLLEQFQTKTEPRLAAQDLFSAIETFWKRVAKTRDEKNEGMNYGKHFKKP